MQKIGSIYDKPVLRDISLDRRAPKEAWIGVLAHRQSSASWLQKKLKEGPSWSNVAIRSSNAFYPKMIGIPLKLARPLESQICTSPPARQG